MTGLSQPSGAEPHTQNGLVRRLNRLRAGVLGANDGIVSVAAIVVGVAGATSSTRAILTAGLAALVGGAISMALGEYVSVSSQRDSERALIAQEKAELQADPVQELTELAELYQARGLSFGDGPEGRRGADRARRARCASGGGARHRHNRRRQPLARRRCVGPGLHSSAGLLPLLAVVLIPAPAQGARDLCDRAARPGAHRRAPVPVSATARRPAPRSASCSAALSALATTFAIGSLLGAPAG